MAYHDNNDIQYVPDAVKVGELVNTQLQDLLHHIIEDEYTEDYLAAEDEIIPRSDVSNQSDCSNLVGWDRPTGRWELNHQPARSRDTSFKYWMYGHQPVAKVESLDGVYLITQNMLMLALYVEKSMKSTLVPLSSHRLSTSSFSMVPLSSLVRLRSS